MIHLGLTGYPLGHSLSPTIHTAALTACGLEGQYSLFPVHPDDKPALADLLSRLRDGQLAGLNVTIPHKQTVIGFLDELTPTASSMGAVNTIYMKDERLTGDNTDAPGFLLDLHKFLDKEPHDPEEKNALVLGAGGSARAVVYALQHDGWQVTLAARRMEQARELADRFRGARAVEFNFPTFQHSNFKLIVNTTPAGMFPNVDQSPWPADIPFPPQAAIYDLVYNPRKTMLVRAACHQGLPATTGLGMLVEQAALSFEIWTGCQPPRKALFTALNQTPITDN